MPFTYAACHDDSFPHHNYHQGHIIGISTRPGKIKGDFYDECIHKANVVSVVLVMVSGMGFERGMQSIMVEGEARTHPGWHR